jgi:hypothetical protein
VLNNEKHPAIRQIMIKKQIPIPKDLSADSIFSIIEMYFAGRYKTTRNSKLRLDIKRLYKYQSNGREMIYKKINFKDYGNFRVKGNSIIFKICLTKQAIFWLTMLIFGFFITWKVWNTSFLLSLFLILTPILIVWINGIIETEKFMSKEIVEISKQLGN